MTKTVSAWFKERFPSVIEMTRHHATDYPTPPNLNYSWAFGFLLMVFLVLQIATGVGTAMFYKPDAHIAFDSVERFRRSVHWGWLIQSIHAVGPTFIFGALYAHIGRGFYYGSYKSPREVLWWIGLFLFLVMMMESFMGYILPWGQMSYWASTVITGLASVIPVIGDTLVIWIRGDILMSDATLGKFFSLHIAFFPLVFIMGLIVLHIMALHDVGSNNPVGVQPARDKKVPFFPYYVVKDLYVVGVVMTVFFFIIFFYPNIFLEAENFKKANPSLTPPEIRPEWYFLPFFSMLRSIPFKGIGVIVVWGAMWVLFFLPFIDRSEIRSGRYRPVKKWLDVVFFANFIFMGYLGSRPPFGWHIPAARIGTAVYLGYFVLVYIVSSREKKPDELLEYERTPEKITLHSSRNGTKIPLAILVIILAALNVWAFSMKFPSREMVEKGRTVYEVKGKAFHDIKYLGEYSPMAAETRKEMLGALPPDLSLRHKILGEKSLRAFLVKFIDKPLEGSRMQVVFTRDEIKPLVAFLEYASDPSLFLRAKLGPWVILFMSVFTVLLYLLYKDVWLIKTRGMDGF